MSTPYDGGPAFPRPDMVCSEEEAVNGVTAPGSPGMFLRDWFAGQAMRGLMGNTDLSDLFKSGLPARKLAEVVYLIADAMIAEREKEVHDATS